ncbi:MAG: ABC transporter permease [Alphaproteobacteria bacterium]|nr:ABC transporter permease [Alphaproteobacteria bacterium]
MVILVLVWEGLVRSFGIPPYLLPAPSRVIVELDKLGVQLWPNVGATLVTVLAGFLVSALVSLPLAVVLAASPFVARAVYPLLLVTQSTPIIAIAPILVVMLGTGQLSRATITFLIAFFPLLVSMVTGLLSTPREIVELSRVLRTSFLQDLWLIRLPASVPFVFSGLKVAISLSVIGAVVAEFVTANKGLGYLITQSTAFFNVPLAFGAVILLSIMGVMLFQAVVLVERLFFSWSAQAERITRD